MNAGKQITEKLKMEPVPDEGGSFVRIYTGKCPSGPDRPEATSILYLLRGAEKSRWHKLSCDELWSYHAGSTAHQLLLYPDGSWAEKILGPDVLNGEMPQTIIPSGTWQCTVLSRRTEDSWGLFGTVCIPGFTYDSYCGAEITDLMKNYPEAAERIRSFGETFHKTE